MKSGHYLEDYQNYVKKKLRGMSRDKAMAQSIGGEFVGFGKMLRDLVFQRGLPLDGFLIDVGCGSGRLANALRDFPELRYTGTDVVQDLLDYAQELVDRPDWKFKRSIDLTIPERDDSADMVCFFSVFTHLLHEETFVYLQEAKRVLKPGGRITFSYLDFTQPHHWAVFQGNLATVRNRDHLNMFIDKAAIPVWARHLGLDVVGIWDGAVPHIELSEDITLDDGRVFSGHATLGQSVCVLEKPAA